VPIAAYAGFQPKLAAMVNAVAAITPMGRQRRISKL
jgi:hypothetical protein